VQDLPALGREHLAGALSLELTGDQSVAVELLTGHEHEPQLLVKDERAEAGKRAQGRQCHTRGAEFARGHFHLSAKELLNLSAPPVKRRVSPRPR
jgi:hypothetical protein